MTPTRRDVFLIDGRTDPPVRVPAVLIRHLSPDRLKEVEDLWGPERGIVQEALAQLGVDMEHGHWDWRNKIERAVKGELLITGLECEGELQGLIAVAARPRYAALLPGSQALYVDYIESAPWNLKATMAGFDVFGEPTARRTVSTGMRRFRRAGSPSATT